MTVEEIFNKVATHMVNGLMYHDELAEAFGFLGLYGYSVQQDYHHLEETNNYRRLSHYYSTHYHKLIVLEAVLKLQKGKNGGKECPEWLVCSWLPCSRHGRWLL